MKRQKNIQLTCLAAFLLALAAGCGGSDDATSETDQEAPAPVSSQSGDNLLQPGRPPLESDADARPRVEIQTSAGTFTVTLRPDCAPGTVQNFLDYVDKGFYNGTIFHQVIRDYAVLGGNYTIDTDGKSILFKEPGGVGINNEAATGLSNKRGTIAMAREPENADSARCQFFINLVDNPSLDYQDPQETIPQWQTAGYCAFGTVDPGGMAILDEISRQDVTSVKEMDLVPVETITIESIQRL